jgi:hypothetical protein
MQTIYLGYGNTAQSETISVTPSGGTTPYTYSWTRTNCNSTTLNSPFTYTDSSYTFSPTAASICKSDSDNVYAFAIIATDAHGCASAPVIKRINVVDPFVGNKIRICHRPPGDPTNTQILHVSANSLQAHFDHGDNLGDCNVFNGKMIKPAKEQPTEAVRVYPNPTTGLFKVELSSISDKALILITDVHGKLVASETLTEDQTPVATSTLAASAQGCIWCRCRMAMRATEQRLLCSRVNAHLLLKSRLRQNLGGFFESQLQICQSMDACGKRENRIDRRVPKCICFAVIDNSIWKDGFFGAFLLEIDVLCKDTGEARWP